MSFSLITMVFQLARLGDLAMKILGFFFMFLSLYQFERGYITLSLIFWFIVGGLLFFNEILLSIWTVKQLRGTRRRR